MAKCKHGEAWKDCPRCQAAATPAKTRLQTVAKYSMRCESCGRELATGALITRVEDEWECEICAL